MAELIKLFQIKSLNGKTKGQIFDLNIYSENVIIASVDTGDEMFNMNLLEFKIKVNYPYFFNKNRISIQTPITMKKFEMSREDQDVLKKTINYAMHDGDQDSYKASKKVLKRRIVFGTIVAIYVAIRWIVRGGDAMDNGEYSIFWFDYIIFAIAFGSVMYNIKLLNE